MSTSPLVRPLTRARITAAAINAALSVAAIVLAVPALYAGAQGSGDADVPFAANILDIALGSLGLVGSGAVLRRQRWGTVLVIVVRALDGLPSLLGLLTPVSATIRFEAGISVVGAALVIYLLLRRQPAVAS